MFDGDWGSKSEIAMAVAAGLALLISLAHVLWGVFWRSSDEQDWQVQLQNAQNKWQSEFESKLVEDQLAWEAQWRKEETERLKAWREEDIARQEAAFLPRLHVAVVKLASSAFVSKSGKDERRAILHIANTGQVPVYLRGPGGFEFQQGDWDFSWQGVKGLLEEPDFEFRREPLAVGQRITSHWDLLYIQDEVSMYWRFNDGPYTIRGFVIDQRGERHYSEAYPFRPYIGPDPPPPPLPSLPF